jgi:hypothetical protein
MFFFMFLTNQPLHASRSSRQHKLASQPRMAVRMRIDRMTWLAGSMAGSMAGSTNANG